MNGERVFIINRREVHDTEIYVRAKTAAEAMALAKAPPIGDRRRNPVVDTSDPTIVSVTYRHTPGKRA